MEGGRAQPAARGGHGRLLRARAPGSGVANAGRGRPGRGGPSGGGPGARSAPRGERPPPAARARCCAPLLLPPSFPLPPSVPTLAAVPSPAARVRVPHRPGRRLRARETPNRWPEPRAAAGEGGEPREARAAGPACEPSGPPAPPARVPSRAPRQRPRRASPQPPARPLGRSLRGVRGAGRPRRRRRHESDRVLREDPGGRAVRRRPHESFQPHPASCDPLPEGHRQGEGPGARGAREGGGEGRRGERDGAGINMALPGKGRREAREAGKGKVPRPRRPRGAPRPGLPAAKLAARPGPRAKPGRARRTPRLRADAPGCRRRRVRGRSGGRSPSSCPSRTARAARQRWARAPLPGRRCRVRNPVPGLSPRPGPAGRAARGNFFWWEESLIIPHTPQTGSVSAASTPWVRAGKDCGDQRFLLGTEGGPASGSWVGVIRSRSGGGGDGDARSSSSRAWPSTGSWRFRGSCAGLLSKHKPEIRH